MVANILVCYH